MDHKSSTKQPYDAEEIKNVCFFCKNPGNKLFDYYVCTDCEKKLGLLSEKTISRHNDSYKKKNKSFEDEIKYRLDFIEKDYVKKRIKLLHIRSKL